MAKTYRLVQAWCTYLGLPVHCFAVFGGFTYMFADAYNKGVTFLWPLWSPEWITILCAAIFWLLPLPVGIFLLAVERRTLRQQLVRIETRYTSQ